MVRFSYTAGLFSGRSMFSSKSLRFIVRCSQLVQVLVLSLVSRSGCWTGTQLFENIEDPLTIYLYTHTVCVPGMNSSSKKFRVQSVDSSVSSTYPSQCQGPLCRASSHQHAGPTTVSRAIICQNSHPINAFDILSIILSPKWLVPTHWTPTLHSQLQTQNLQTPNSIPPPTCISILSAFTNDLFFKNFCKVVAPATNFLERTHILQERKKHDFVIHAKKRSQLHLPDWKI